VTPILEIVEGGTKSGGAWSSKMGRKGFSLGEETKYTENLVWGGSREGGGDQK